MLKIESEEVRIIQKVGIDWKIVASFLGFDHNKIQTFEHDHPHETEAACTKMFMEWLDSKDATWENLIKALYDAERSELAKRVEKWLTAVDSQVTVIT